MNNYYVKIFWVIVSLIAIIVGTIYKQFDIVAITLALLIICMWSWNLKRK